jgi:hypothetical protein
MNVQLEKTNLLCQAFADSCKNGLVFDVVMVIGLEFGREAVQGTLESIFRRGVNHLGLHMCQFLLRSMGGFF